MSDPTAPVMFATAFPVAHHHRLDTTRPCYWRLTTDNGRTVVVLAMSMNDAARWGEQIFHGAPFNGDKLRTAIGTPPF